MKTLKQTADNGDAYKAPFGHEDIREEFLHRASQSDVSIEELLNWACAHIGQIRTQFHDEDKHWTTEETLDLLALAIVKLQRGHPLQGGVTELEVRGVAERIKHFQEVIPG